LLGPSIHASRCQFVRSLPAASRILDLGGTHLGDDVGALVALGYPYQFDELVIVDLPSDERHPLYQREHVLGRVDSRCGPVQYRYHSMTDLSSYDDESFGLVYSGQTIEHVTEEECDFVLAQVARVLCPGGHLAVDTPNARATRLQQDEFIDPDHKVEYTHAQFSAKLHDAGFDIVAAKGLNYVGEGLVAGTFSNDEAATNQGMYDAIEDCYVLAYVARKRVPAHGDMTP
jgi:predicted SAM-dependent methyltransferase